MAETLQESLTDLVRTTRERMTGELGALAEQLRKLEQGLQEARSAHRQIEQSLQQQLDVLEKVPAAAPTAAASDTSLEKVLAAVRNLITATLPEQVMDVLTEEGEQLGVRAAVFDVRGKAAWGSSARGFGADLSERSFRGVIVPLNQDSPFRQCFETGGHVDTSLAQLKRVRSVVDKLRPASGEHVLLLPVRSAGSVSAIFYADPGGKQRPLPVDALKILAEFAGAQLDRLMAFSGVSPAEAVEEKVPEVEPAPVEVEVAVEEPAAEPPVEAAARAASVAPAPKPEASASFEPRVEEPPPPPPPVTEPARAEAPPAPSGAVDLSQASEADQKTHRDARRFAKLLVSEIELYNKAKVADGRKNGDLYKRLKSDIERSRLTYAKRFGKTLAAPQDYFHEEVVRILANNDSSLLGSEYPGPSQ